MKRTTLWVTLAATGVQLAALGLCAWAMQSSREGNRAFAKPRPADVPLPIAPAPVTPQPGAPAGSEASVAAAVADVPISIEITNGATVEPGADPPASSKPIPADVIAPAPVFAEVIAAEPAAAEAIVPQPVAAHVIAPEPIAPEPIAPEPLAAVSPVAPDAPAEVAPYTSAIEIAPAVDPDDGLPDIWADPATPAAWTPPADTTTQPSPVSHAAQPSDAAVAATPDPPHVAVAPSTTGVPARAIPRFILNFADDQTQIVVAEEGDPPIVFGIFADGNVRCVDVDNGCYGGKAEGERSRMREVAGSRAFTVQLEPNEDGSFTASFVGGLHDGQHVTLLPVVIAGRA